jgi:hypothetical protein
MRIILLIILLSLYTWHVQGQLNVSDGRITEAVKKLHSNLVVKANSDEEKLRAFYQWICQNINYDVKEWTSPSGDWMKQEPDEVLKRRLAICHGYSELFKALCELSDIPCHLVSGYTKKQNRFQPEGHTWNVVYLNNEWFHVDATWGAGGIESNGKYVRYYDESYFLSNPKKFLSEHFPFDPAWQLIDFPISLEQFKRVSESDLQNIKGPVFYNYNDTLAQWITLEGDLKQLASARRMIRHSPGDKLAAREHAHAVFQLASNEMKKGNDLLQTLYPAQDGKHYSTNKANISEADFQNNLHTVRRHYQIADSLYRQVQVNDALIRKNLDQARSVLKHNLGIVNSALNR